MPRLSAPRTTSPFTTCTSSRSGSPWQQLQPQPPQQQINQARALAPPALALDEEPVDASLQAEAVARERVEAEAEEVFAGAPEEEGGRGGCRAAQAGWA
jgi:hypothetical protein